MHFPKLTLTLCCMAVAFGGLAACSSDDSPVTATIEVSSTADACTLSASKAPTGNIAFEVSNDGSEETEFYIYKPDGTSIVAEVEHIGPGTSRTLKAKLAVGEYVTACKPGMEGDGIRATFTAE